MIFVSIRVEELQQQKKLIELRKLLTSYDLRHYNLSDSDSAEVSVVDHKMI